MVATAQSRNVLDARGKKKTLNINPVLNKLKLCQLVIWLMSYQLIHIFLVFERSATKRQSICLIISLTLSVAPVIDTLAINVYYVVYCVTPFKMTDK
jgi:hypothetical protein